MDVVPECEIGSQIATLAKFSRRKPALTYRAGVIMSEHVESKERSRRMLQMAFPLYLSYLTSDQKPASTTCFVPAPQPATNNNGQQPAGANRHTQQTIQVQAKAMDAGGGGGGGGAPVPVVPMDCYEDMFHEIAKKFYGENALVAGGIVQAGPDQNGTSAAPGQQASANQTELGLMDLDYQQVAKDGHYQATTQGPPTLIVQTTGGPVLQLTMEPTPHVTTNAATAPPSTNPSPPKKPKMSVKSKKTAVAATQVAAATVATAILPTSNLGGSAPGAIVKPAEPAWVESEELLPWNSSKVASYSSIHKLFRCLDCGCVGFLARIAEHWLGTHANLRVFQCPRCHYTSAWARCVRIHLVRQHNEKADETQWRENPVLAEIVKYLIALKNRVESKDEAPAPANGATGTGGAEKRYSCPYCPYATDRRDLYTRHETIHSDEKPFQCFICDKQFNRADHCKKHFSRMHRDTAYDLQKIKKAAAAAAAAASTNASTTNATAPAADAHHGHHTTPVQKTAPAAHVVLTAAPATQVPFYTTIAVQNAPVTNQQQHQPGQQQQAQQQQPQQQNAVQRATAATVVATYQPHISLPAFPSQPAANQTYKNYTTLGVDAIVRPIQTTTTTATTTTTPAANNAQQTSENKKKKEKLFACTYCAWRGVDNWCLKRHLNTHIKPFLCVLCDYKAARSERLATHVHKVHNKRICGKCNYLADDQDALGQHMREHQ